MVKLETVEDFEKVRKALSDSSSKPRHYSVKPFSYCPHCNDVKEFEAPVFVSNHDLITVKCLGCRSFFQITDHIRRDEIMWGARYAEVIDQIPDFFRAESKRLNSREMQSAFYTVALERRIAEEKTNQRRIKDKIQDLAKLRI